VKRRRPATDEVVVEVRGTGSDDGFSGIVVEGGAGPGPTVGDEVFGVVPTRVGPAELVLCRRRALARKPAALAYAEAAALAEAGWIALRAVRLSEVGVGDRVMITGADGGGGAIAVQIAKIRGSHVTAVCGDRDVPLVWDLGADEVRARERGPCDRGRFEAVIDTDRSVTPEIAEQLLEPEGRLIAIRRGDIHVWSARGVPVAVQQASPPGEIDLSELVELVEREGVFPIPR
jgi:NADPH:quinone reductase-like Zn-dependent oxidoreductase